MYASHVHTNFMNMQHRFLYSIECSDNASELSTQSYPWPMTLPTVTTHVD